jgi:hypothetical protein
MSFVNVHKNCSLSIFLLNPGNISHTSSSHNTAIHCIHICPLPCQAVAEDITSKCKRSETKSVMPHNPCLTTHQKENKSMLIYVHNPELITRMKHMRCFHNFEEPVKQMLWPAVLPFSCHLAITDHLLKLCSKGSIYITWISRVKAVCKKILHPKTLSLVFVIQILITQCLLTVCQAAVF